MQTESQMAPPKPPDGRKSLTGFPDDEMAELAGKIAALSKPEASELLSYLKHRYGIAAA
jgi:hypothetical protein